MNQILNAKNKNIYKVEVSPVKNYYVLTKGQLKKELNLIKDWLFDNPTHPLYKRAEFALDVAYSASQLERDDFIDQVLLNLIGSDLVIDKIDK